jgi:hypothetical protein
VVEKLVYLVLVQESEKLLKRRLRGFGEIQLGNCHAFETHQLRRYEISDRHRADGRRGGRSQIAVYH